MLTFDGCQKGAEPWVEKYFHDCVYDIRDAVGFALGLCSIFVWLNAQLPQFFSNIKNQSSEALSIWFLVEWFAGDTLNLLGCLIQGQQLPTTTILAAYFVLMDVIMLLQYIYYGALQARRRRLRAKAHRKRHAGHHRHGAHHSKDSPQQRRGPESIRSLRTACPDSSDGDLTPGPTPTYTSEHSPFPLTHGAGTAGAAGGAGSAGAGAGNWRTAAVATAAGMSLVCVTALALRPTWVPPPGGSGSAATAAGEWQPAGSLALARRNLLLSGPESVAVASATAPAYAGGDIPRGWGWGKKHGDGGDGGGSGDSGCSFLNCDIALVAGTVMGYLSTCFYLASRVSQIRKNLARRSTEGLSPFMFLLTMSANLCTGVSIVLRLRSLQQLKDQLPWMCGTFGTIALDMTLFYQALTLGQHGHGHGHGHGGGHGHGSGGGHGAGPAGGHGHSSGHHHHHHHHYHAAAVVAAANGVGGCSQAGSDCEGGGGGGGRAAAKPVSDLEAPLLGQRDAAEDG